ncbi:hypothetical protein N7535_001487 [Penicillium sp. DV-2018c]|nr:hypothetical protein N7461_005268 [Penicillium sp. DV-2018c]KAJ5582867.1 hypothetical protein N7535_001487 [Penicillium sp. DV-2018c]
MVMESDIRILRTEYLCLQCGGAPVGHLPRSRPWVWADRRGSLILEVDLLQWAEFAVRPLVGPYVTGFIRSIHKYAMNAQRDDGQGMTEVFETLTKINVNTERLNQRMEKIETTISAPAADSAAAWRSFRGRDQATTQAVFDLNSGEKRERK